MAWSMVALLWWLAACLLVRQCHGAQPPDGPQLDEIITIFKPLPQLGPGGAHPDLRAALASFARQLDAQTEMLVGVHEADHAAAQPWLDELLAEAPGRVRLFFRNEADSHANPKISWLEWLAPQAQGTWWMWSDADIVAPNGWLQRARAAALAFPAANLVTFPYYVRQPAYDQGWWDAAFVNAEILPGACLMHALGRNVNFAFGAAMLFRRQDFLAKCDWCALGQNLADDFAIGQTMISCRICLPPLETLALESSWPNALRHYFRWQKTIRWCQPAGYACQLLITPLLGWIAYAMLYPRNYLAWVGFGSQFFVELGIVLHLNHLLKVRLNARGLLALAIWPLLRAGTWLLVWTPLPVRWNRTIWRGRQKP